MYSENIFCEIVSAITRFFFFVWQFNTMHAATIVVTETFGPQFQYQTNWEKRIFSNFAGHVSENNC